MDDELLGWHELKALFNLSPGSLACRVAADDFPEPVAELAGGRIWRRSDVIAYARARCEQYDERPEVRALAELGR